MADHKQKADELEKLFTVFDATYDEVEKKIQALEENLEATRKAQTAAEDAPAADGSCSADREQGSGSDG